ncbi:MAG: YkgJ family cysteine cluster protein [Planctomycetes bacterium]|nr:YkgJ family cysteine cluster protein [Planctomycetota bacterium]
MTRDSLKTLKALHGRVDADASKLAARHGERLQCRLGCKDCCVDALTVFEVEAERIRQHHGALLREGTPHAQGACAFLDGDGGCRIYEDRPFVCRTQGLPLLWFEETEDGEITESRDICPLNAEGEPLEHLPHDACWTLGTVELELQALQDRFGVSGARVALRDLFHQHGP